MKNLSKIQRISGTLSIPKQFGQWFFNIEISMSVICCSNSHRLLWLRKEFFGRFFGNDKTSCLVATRFLFENIRITVDHQFKGFVWKKASVQVGKNAQVLHRFVEDASSDNNRQCVGIHSVVGGDGHTGRITTWNVGKLKRMEWNGLPSQVIHQIS